MLALCFCLLGVGGALDDGKQRLRLAGLSKDAPGSFLEESNQAHSLAQSKLALFAANVLSLEETANEVRATSAVMHAVMADRKMSDEEKLSALKTLQGHMEAMKRKALHALENMGLVAESAAAAGLLGISPDTATGKESGAAESTEPAKPEPAESAKEQDPKASSSDAAGDEANKQAAKDTIKAGQAPEAPAASAPGEEKKVPDEKETKEKDDGKDTKTQDGENKAPKNPPDVKPEDPNAKRGPEAPAAKEQNPGSPIDKSVTPTSKLTLGSSRK